MPSETTANLPVQTGSGVIDLKALRRTTDEAINDAIEHRSEISGAVNWTDLSCINAFEWRDDDGDFGWYVQIEEADPSCVDFHSHIERYLEARGFPGVTVRTEW
jgi:hypothetical protein